VICEISLRSLRRGARRQTSGRGSLISRTAEPENRQENDSQKSQTDPEARTFAKAFRQIDAENYADNKFTNGINIKMIHQAGRPTILHQM
jgi:hypothetical protein